MPLCSRCTGIYAGFLVGLIYQIILGKKKSGFPPLSIFLFSIFFILLMAFQVIASPHIYWLGNNQIRFIAGLLCGGSISIFFFPVFNYFFFKESFDKPVVKNWKEYLLLLAVLGIIFLIHFIKILFTFYFLSYASVIGVIAIYLMMNTFLASVILGWKRKKKDCKLIISLILLVILLFFGEIMLFKHNPLKL